MAAGYTDDQKRQLIDSIMNGSPNEGKVGNTSLNQPSTKLPDTINGKTVIRSKELHKDEIPATDTKAKTAINDLEKMPKVAEAATPNQQVPAPNIEAPTGQLEETPEQRVQDLSDEQAADLYQQLDPEEQNETDPDNEIEEQQLHNLELDDHETEANTYGDPEDVQNEDPDIANQVVTHIAETDQFHSPEQAQAALNLYATSPSGQQFIRTSPSELVLQTALGRELQKIAEQHTIVPDSPNPNAAKLPFQQGNGVYVDPVSGRPVSRPGFFKRLGNAIKYALGMGDMYETQPMQGMSQGQPQQGQGNPQQQGMQTAQAFNAFNGLGGMQGMGQQAPQPMQTGNPQEDVQRILQGGAGIMPNMQQNAQQPPYMIPQNSQMMNGSQGQMPDMSKFTNMASAQGHEPVYNPYAPFNNI